MSAYLHRLITRDHAPDVALSPFVRSRSPIAAIDQRLAVDESLGHGLAELAAAEPDSEPDSEHELAEPLPSPRPITVPTPASAPESSSPTIQRKLAAPLVSEAAATSAESPSSSTRARAPQLDPGPLFDLDPSPRYFDETRIHEIVHESTTTSLAPPEPRVAPHPAAEPRVAPHPLDEPRIAPRPPPPALEPRTVPIPTQAFAPTPTPAPAPWRPFEPLAPTVEPALVPARPALLPSAPAPALARLEPNPRTHRPIAAHPAELPTTESVQVQTPRSVQVRNAPVERETTPRTPPPRSTPQRKARLDIESISQIGPLDRHFPNRRRLRLRYR